MSSTSATVGVRHDAPLKIFIYYLSGGLQESSLAITDVPRPVGAVQGTSYHVKPSSDDLFPDIDRTSFVPEQEYIAENNLPLMMGLLTEMGPIGMEPTKPVVDHDRENIWGKPYRIFPLWLLPDKISHNVEGWRVAYWQRLGKPYDLKLADILARFDVRLFDEGGPLHKYVKNMNGLRNRIEMRMQRYNKSAGVPTVTSGLPGGRSGYSDQMLHRVSTLTDEQILHGTIWQLAGDGDGKTYIQQPNNPWGCSFELPPGLPLTQYPATIRVAHEKIEKKQQMLAERFANDAKIKNWWQVTLDTKKPCRIGEDETGHHDAAAGPARKTTLSVRPQPLTVFSNQGPTTTVTEDDTFTNDAALESSGQTDYLANDPTLQAFLLSEDIVIDPTLVALTQDTEHAREDSIYTSQPSESPMEKWFFDTLDKVAEDTVSDDDFKGFFGIRR